MPRSLLRARRLPSLGLVLALTLGILAAALGPATGNQQVGDLLVVVGDDGAQTPGELALVTHLTARGHGVTAIADDDVTPAAAAGHDLVWLSSNVASRAVDPQLAAVAVPVVVSKPWLFDEFGLAAASNGSYGTSIVDALDITTPGDPAAGGLSGAVTLTPTAGRVGWGVAPPSATVVATADGVPSLYHVAGGLDLASGAPAPACRMAFPAFKNAPAAFLPDAWTLVDAAVGHALEDCTEDQDPDDPPLLPPSEQVVIVSIDGFGSNAIADLGPAALPGWSRLVAEGATTTNARTAPTQTRTMPNHASMFTGRAVPVPGGHGVNFNQDNGTREIHEVAGEYVASIFDVVHDNGGATHVYTGKSKFEFYDRSWDAGSGAPDVTGPDDGRDKIDVFRRTNSNTLLAELLDALDTQRPALSVLHMRDPDSAGHANVFGSPEYLAAVQASDARVAQLLDHVSSNPALARTTVILTADHGGTGTNHSDPTVPVHYTIPFAVWGHGVEAGQDLYALNPQRTDPGVGQPGFGMQPPIRSADAANLAMDLLDLGTVPGSQFNTGQDLTVGDAPDDGGDGGDDDRAAVLVVTGDDDPGPGEQAVIDHLASLDLDVTSSDDDDVAPVDADAHDLVWITSRVDPSDWPAGLLATSTPTVLAKPWLFDDYGMVPFGPGTKGAPFVTDIAIVDALDPTADGLSGAVALTSGTTQVSVGDPPPSATVVATALGRATIFRIDPGDDLADGTLAPGCRLAFPAYKAEPTSFLPAAWDLLDATVAHALAGCPS